MKQKNTIKFISFLIILVAIYYSFYSLTPSKNSSKNIPLTKFSTSRAYTKLETLAIKPHFVGSVNHNKVRDLLFKDLQKLGLHPTIQTQMAINKKWRSAANIQNIIARIKGTGNGKALLLLSHYDSSPHSSIGGSDDGAGIVTILEGLRAFLAKGTQPKNDIIIVFSDAEELGLLGATAFVKHHPWAKHIGLVINFEARGSGGPSYMLLETNGGNEKLIKQFSIANPSYPDANSLMYSIYKMLPNDTDLTVFRKDGNINGFNFAFIGDHFDYHTAQDTPKRLDKKTLAHQGSYIMPLLSYFANADLTQLNSKNDDVYFNFPLFKLVHYPYSYIIPLFIIAIIWFLIALFFGLARGKLTFKGIAIGFIPFLSSLISTILVGVYGWKLLLKIFPQYNDILQGFTYNGYTYIWTFSALFLGITLLTYKKYLKKYKKADLLIAPITCWLLLNLLIVIYLKGASFFIIPVYFSLWSLWIVLFSKKQKQQKILFTTILSIPLLLIFTPFIRQFPVGLGLKMIGISAFLIVFMVGLLIPFFAYLKKTKILIIIITLITIIGFIKSSANSTYSINRKKPNSVLYIYNADKNKAYWASYDNKVDEFTKQFLGTNPSHGDIEKSNVNSKYKTKLNLFKKAKVISLAKTKIEIISDTIINNYHSINMIIKPQRKTNRIELIANNTIHFIDFNVNGESSKNNLTSPFVFDTKSNTQIVSYFFTKKDEEINLKFTIPKNEKPAITIYSSTYDLYTNPNFKIKPRTPTMMPTPFVLNDATVIKQTINI